MSQKTRFYTGDEPNLAARSIFKVLRKRFRIRAKEFASLKAAKEFKDAFRTLVITILSQNSTDISAIRAFDRLEGSLGITPQLLAAADVSKIEKAIEVGGLYRTKARAIKKLAQILLDQFGGKLDTILKLPLDEARETLMSLPQVGPKSADVLLVSVGGKPTVPVDTHVNRVSRRLGLAPLEGDYEDVRQSLQKLYPPRFYHELHLLLIAHGRRYCTARKPLCPVCPVRNYCPYPQKTKTKDLA